MEGIKDMEIAANKGMKADELASQEKTAKMSADASEKADSDKANENQTQEKIIVFHIPTYDIVHLYSNSLLHRFYLKKNTDKRDKREKIEE